MEEMSSKYSFRKRDYAKIKNWSELAKNNFIPITEDLQPAHPAHKTQKHKQSHYKFTFSNLLLQETFVNANSKNISQVKKIVLLSSLYQKSKGELADTGKEIAIDCEFSLADFTISHKEDVIYYFYLEDNQPKDYEFFLEIQMINHQGSFSRIGACRIPLIYSRELPKVMKLPIVSRIGETNGNSFIEQNSKSRSKDNRKSKSKDKRDKKRQVDQDASMIGFLELQCDFQEIKEINKFLPPLRIIDNNTKLPPATLILKKKKDQLITDPPFKVTIQELMVRIEQPQTLKKQLLANNPYTLSHKELVDLQIKSYRLIIDSHNGWKFLNEKQSEIIMDLAIEKEYQIYLSSKKVEGLIRNYYEADLTVLIAIVFCKVEFKLKGISQDKRTGQYLLAWLPLPLDLAVKENRLEMMMVNDVPFPATTLPMLNIKCVISATILHPLHQKYKSKYDDKKIYTNDFPVAKTEISNSTKYMKLNSRKRITEHMSTEQQAQRNLQIDRQIEHYKQLFAQGQLQREKQRFVKIMGRAEVLEIRNRHQTQISMQSTVGKVIKFHLELTSLIPQTDYPTEYYIPKNMRGYLYFMRHKFEFDCRISQKTVKYQIPIRLNASKSNFHFKVPVQTVNEFNSLLDSKLVIVLFEEDTELIYAKGIEDAFEVIGTGETDKVLFVRLLIYTEFGYKTFGTLLFNVDWQVEKPKANSTMVEQFQFGKEIHKLSMDERLKMRIGNYKGDTDIKNRAVALLKQKKHGELIGNIVENELSCDGEILYEIGLDCYHLVSFTNEDKSQNNVFTFHLNCAYAQLVTDESQFRKVMNELNEQIQNFHRLQFVYKQPLLSSYYQATLRYNQSVGLLIKMNVNQYSEGGRSVSKLELLIKRNTIETKKVRLRCKMKEILVWDYVSQYDITADNDYKSNELRVKLSEEISSQYRDIFSLNAHTKYDPKTKEIVFSRYTTTTYELLLKAHPLAQKTEIMLFYRITLLQGEERTMQAGQRYIAELSVDMKTPMMILRGYQKELTILNPIKLNIDHSEEQKQLAFQFLKPFKTKSVFVSCYDISGVKVMDYLFKINSKADIVPIKIEVPQKNQISFTINCRNPYACTSKFDIISSLSSLKISDTQIQIDAYKTRLVICRTTDDYWSEKRIYIYLIDHLGDVIQINEVFFTVPQIMMQNTH